LAKLDKSKYTPDEWRELQTQRKLYKIKRRAQKEAKRSQKPIQYEKVQIKQKYGSAFVIGNGTSRTPINVEDLANLGNTYGCNALYRTFAPDYLIAVDVKMILEISRQGYQRKHTVWTNPNKAYGQIQDLNTFNPSKGWSSGPTALWLASQHGYDRIYILGFDYRGIKEKFNNVYADTPNYKKSQDGATFFGNWLRQTVSVINEHKNIQYVRVIASDNYCPEELNKISNFTTITVDDFMKIHQLS
jgi:hypothetical protein|tara:strand:- start:1195 stop:1929 length:735 start_codon:yes stop_codon:yes gene_type:complete